MGIDERRKLRSLELNLKAVVASVPELELTPQDVTCFFPQAHTDSRDIIMFVDGLFENTRRTIAVRRQLAEMLVDCIRTESADDSQLVECFIRPFNPGWGFAMSRPIPKE